MSVIFVDSGHIVLAQKLSVVRELGGRVTLMLRLPLQEGYRSTRILLLFSHDVFTRQGNITLARGLPYLPCKRSARDNSLSADVHDR